MDRRHELTEEQQGGTKPLAEASAEAPTSEQTVGAVAVADEPATSPSLDTEALGTRQPRRDDSARAGGVAAARDARRPADARGGRRPSPSAADATEAPRGRRAETDAGRCRDPEAPVAGPEQPADPATSRSCRPRQPRPRPQRSAETDSARRRARRHGRRADGERGGPSCRAPSRRAAEGPEAPPRAEPATRPAELPPEAARPRPAPTPVPTGPEPTTMEELLAEQDADIKSFKHGDVVEGSVVRIDKDEILVDIGAKSEGVVSNRELFGRNTEASRRSTIGDVVLVYVLQPESPEGHVVLSLRRAGLERKWRSMQEQFEAGVIIEAPVIDHNKGGLIVDCGIRGFVPISQIVDFPRRPQNDQPRDAAQEIAEKLQPFVGRKLRLKILEVNRKANRLILSEKVALYEERREKRDELFSSLQVGQKVTGHVRSIAPFGVFVDLGGIDGLVHKSELSWNKVNNPEGGYRVGEEVEAEVIDINHERGRISLSIRRLQPDPWHSTVADFKVGDVIDGTVTKLVNFGAFVRVRDGLEGLIHISELSNQRVAHPGDVVHEGQNLKLRIISLDSERHRLGLSLKQAEEASARPVAEPGEADDAAVGPASGAPRATPSVAIDAHVAAIAIDPALQRVRRGPGARGRDRHHPRRSLRRRARAARARRGRRGGTRRRPQATTRTPRQPPPRPRSPRPPSRRLLPTPSPSPKRTRCRRGRDRRPRPRAAAEPEAEAVAEAEPEAAEAVAEPVAEAEPEPEAAEASRRARRRARARGRGRARGHRGPGCRGRRRARRGRSRVRRARRRQGRPTSRAADEDQAEALAVARPAHDRDHSRPRGRPSRLTRSGRFAARLVTRHARAEVLNGANRVLGSGSRQEGAQRGTGVRLHGAIRQVH